MTLKKFFTAFVFCIMTAGLLVSCGNEKTRSQEQNPGVEKFKPSAITLVKIECKNPNRLAKEKSPYLLQHACNPVDWEPWGEEAFEKARKENKLIFLSIGYSTCHWCHVMERESFSDAEVAAILNKYFVAIKVDREERPDIDGVYMQVCQMISGHCGWPLNIIMTWDKKPFFASTYIPKGDKFGRQGMLSLLPRISKLWGNPSERKKLLAQSSQIITLLQQVSVESGKEDLNTSTLKLAWQQLSRAFDAKNGGFGNAPKFPSPHTLLFLLRAWKRTGGANALAMVEKTLQAMRNGGIYDHVGFGFHRYSTDAYWLVPHFEKMLYDQAMLAMAYTEAFQATGKNEYEQTAREILTYVLRDMTSPDGAFYSAEDADSEGEEGKFYLWTEDEIKKILGGKDGEFFARVFNVQKDGNFIEQGAEEKSSKNILHLAKSLKEIAVELKIPEDELRAQIEDAREKLFEDREKRAHPFKDDKILTDWNGLMLAALAKAGQALDEPQYIRAAKKTADFILKKMRAKDGRLQHRFRGGEAGLPAHLDDYAFLAWGLLELYEATFELKYLENAIALNKDMIDQFWDYKSGGFYFSAHDGENLQTRLKEIYDGAMPSGNSVAMLNLIRLGLMTGNAEYEEKAQKMARAFSISVKPSPAAYTFMMCALDFAMGPSFEVVVVGKENSEDTKTMLKALRKNYAPDKVVLFRSDTEEKPAISKLAPFTEFQHSKNGKATAYVCLDYVCKLPVTDPEKMLALLNEKNPKKPQKIKPLFEN